MSAANNVSGVPSTSPLLSFSAIFVFGDSLFDNGNNNKLLTLAKANFWPYGIDSSWGPTGRFSNGKIFIDLLGELLNHPYLPAYEDSTDPKSILRGVNYASAASGILEETGRHLGDHIPFSQQVQNFQKTLSQLKEQIDDKELSQYLATSLAVVNLGSNDYINNYLLPLLYDTRSRYDSQAFADLLIQRHKSYIMVSFKYAYSLSMDQNLKILKVEVVMLLLLYKFCMVLDSENSCWPELDHSAAYRFNYPYAYPGQVQDSVCKM